MYLHDGFIPSEHIQKRLDKLEKETGNQRRKLSTLPDLKRKIEDHERRLSDVKSNMDVIFTNELLNYHPRSKYPVNEPNYPPPVA
ncbi:hypothetical protein UA08_04492 [Talaromyces atroroseus]|uniref:Uncharacterized protein n=1 Tax=Talaromyces atroroseus TaxID=1441469 RepID=A0A225AWV8_TALAT|nr:hypothetical protein UA08_04492 [Talaromyces atroroseus]OKL60099.1 hypothetical protein UA08_04492 [Talaromyces atroroseus]